MQEDYVHSQFGIDEIYFHAGFELNLLQKLQQRALLSLDGEDNIALKYASHDMILIFHKQVPSIGLIYRFLKFLSNYKERENFIQSNTLFNEEELFLAIKSKDFGLVTQRTLLKETYSPPSKKDV